MRKPKPLTVVEYPDIRPGQDYLARLAGVRIKWKTHELLATLQLLDREQEGRTLETILTLPVRPAGRTAEFLRACGTDVAINAEIRAEELVGRCLTVQFGAAANGEAPSPNSFGAHA